MPTSTTGSRAAFAASLGLSGLAALFWLLVLATLSDLSSSDAAGNGLAQAFGAVEVIILWMLLAILMIIAAVNGQIPPTAGLAALILVPASGVVTMIALGLLSEPRISPFLWPIIIPAVIPPFVIAFGLLAQVPSFRSAIPPGVASGFIWATIFILCVAIAPMNYLRKIAKQHQAAARTQYAADYASLPADSPLWDLTPFLATADDTRQETVLERIRHLDRRQSDAEIMLDRGDFPLGFLGRLDLDPTAAICDKARGLLRRQVEPLTLKTANSKPYTDIASAVADAVAAMNWLVGYGCPCDAETHAWESMADSYRGTNFDVVRLAELRDPKEVGRILREDPASFAMLTPQSHLKAWLKFADDKNFHDQALAGARTLDHRTTDAVEMLNDNQYAAQTLMGYLPDLDLQATAPLCTAALKEQFRELTPVYRPTADDPRSYRELLERLGGGNPFATLMWLASHGCDADTELSQAETIVRSYLDSPQRSVMLDALAPLHRKP
jgi:hypothetical protein